MAGPGGGGGALGFGRAGARLVAEVSVLPETLDRRGDAAGASPLSLAPLPPYNVRDPLGAFGRRWRGGRGG